MKIRSKSFQIRRASIEKLAGAWCDIGTQEVCCDCVSTQEMGSGRQLWVRLLGHFSLGKAFRFNSSIVGRSLVILGNEVKLIEVHF